MLICVICRLLLLMVKTLKTLMMRFMPSARKSGGWRLWVAIADVSWYVRPDSELDKEAYQRANSTYFPEFVVPMLPELLSNGLCSLNPKVDRLAMVCEMTISESGNLSGYQFYEAVISSHARLTYTKVGKMLMQPARGRVKSIACRVRGCGSSSRRLCTVCTLLCVKRARSVVRSISILLKHG